MLTVARRELPYRVLRNLQKRTEQQSARLVKVMMEQVIGIIKAAQPHQDEEVLRGAMLRKSLDPAEEEVLARLARGLTREDFVALTSGVGESLQEKESNVTAEYADQRRAKVWMNSYVLFRGQGMKDEAAKEAVERDPEYKRIKNLAEAANRLRANVGVRWDETRKKALKGVKVALWSLGELEQFWEESRLREP